MPTQWIHGIPLSQSGAMTSLALEGHTPVKYYHAVADVTFTGGEEHSVKCIRAAAAAAVSTAGVTRKACWALLFKCFQAAAAAEGSARLLLH